jgi:predicted N-acetyltransferase YhbS
MFSITTERAEDGPAIETLLDLAFGLQRQEKLSYRYRQGIAPLSELSLVARADADGALVGTIRYWPLLIAPRNLPALLLGPLAIHPDWAGKGAGRALVRQTLDMAAWARHRIVLLVGDMDYYGRFGFAPAAPHGIVMPGENPARLLALELAPGALAQPGGKIQPWRSVRPGTCGLKAA